MPFVLRGCVLWLLVAMLAGCVTPAPGLREAGGEPRESFSWSQVQEDPACVVPLCDASRCAFWRCGDVDVWLGEAVGDSPSIVKVRGPLVRLPPPRGAPMRWWGRPVGAPDDRGDPVFEIPWHNWKAREQDKPKDRTFYCLPSPEPLEKHHIFPQEPVLARWFHEKGISIHDFTLPFAKSFHAYLHGGGPR